MVLHTTIPIYGYGYGDQGHNNTFGNFGPRYEDGCPKFFFRTFELIKISLFTFLISIFMLKNKRTKSTIWNYGLGYQSIYIYIYIDLVSRIH